MEDLLYATVSVRFRRQELGTTRITAKARLLGALLRLVRVCC